VVQLSRLKWGTGEMALKPTKRSAKTETVERWSSLYTVLRVKNKIGKAINELALEI
jgi:hypothetical protein